MVLLNGALNAYKTAFFGQTLRLVEYVQCIQYMRKGVWGGGLFARKILKVKKEKSKKTNKHERVYGLRFTGTGTG